MRQWMLALLVAGAAAVASVHANTARNTCSDPCYNYTDGCDSCGSFEIYGAPLFMRPSTSDLNYAILDNRSFVVVNTQNQPTGIATFSPKGVEQGTCADYQWGFRVGAGYVMDSGCKDARVNYTRLHSNDKHQVTEAAAQGVWPTQGMGVMSGFVFADTTGFDGGVAATASQRVRFNWDAIDAEVANREMKGCNMWVRSHIGLHWTDLKITRAASYAGSTGFNNGGFVNAKTDLTSQTKTWGIGPRFGADVRYDVMCGFGVGGHCGAALLGGKSSRTFAQETSSTNGTATITGATDVRRKDCCIVFPEFDAALGVNYLWCCNDSFTVFCELGYEFRSYINAIHHAAWGGAGALDAAQCGSVNFDGLYLDLRVMF